MMNSYMRMLPNPPGSALRGRYWPWPLLKLGALLKPCTWMGPTLEPLDVRNMKDEPCIALLTLFQGQGPT